MKPKFNIQVVPNVCWTDRKDSKLLPAVFTPKKFVELVGNFDDSCYDSFEGGDQFGAFILGMCVLKGKFSVECGNDDINKYMNIPQWKEMSDEEFDGVTYTCTIVE